MEDDGGEVVTSWWRVKKEGDWDFMVLVVGGRVAACPVPIGIKIGDFWKDARKTLNEWGFTSTMESPL